MSRRTGQNGTIEERNGAWRGRFLVDIPGQMERQKRSVVLGFKKDMTKSEAKRKLKEIIRHEGIDLPTYCYLAEEVKQIVEAAKGQYKVLFKLAAETGARAGELYALTVDDLLFDHNVIRINKSMYRQKVGSPKTKNANRWVNVKPYVMEMLKTHLNGRTSGLVFQSKRKTALVNCVVLNKHLHPLLRKLGLERGGMHAFRHHRVSTLVMAGTAIEVIKKWIGPGSEEMIRRYTHLRPDFMQDELARVPDFALEIGSKVAVFDPFDPKLQAVA